MSLFDRYGLLGQDVYRQRIAEQNARPQIWPRIVTAPQTSAGLLPIESSGSVPGVSNAPSGPPGGPVGPGPDQAPVDAGVSNLGFLEGLATFGPIGLSMMGPMAAFSIGRTIANEISKNAETRSDQSPIGSDIGRAVGMGLSDPAASPSSGIGGPPGPQSASPDIGPGMGPDSASGQAQVGPTGIGGRAGGHTGTTEQGQGNSGGEGTK